MYTDLDNLIAEMNLPVLQDLVPWVDGRDQASGEFFDAGVSDVLLEKINESAVGELHGYIRGIYVLPLESPADPVATRTVNELMHYLCYKQGNAEKIEASVVELYKMLVKRMQAMQRREMKLDHDMVSSDEDLQSSFPYIVPDAKFPPGFTKMF